jgi:hypothetical protein
MKRLSLLFGLWLWFLVAGQAAAASNPVIEGEISGVEICAQFLEQCKAAVFTGTCDCEIDSRDTPGFFWVSVQHDPLPMPFDSSDILGGKWNLTTLRGSFSGKVIGGSIINNNDNTFTIDATLRIQKKGNGEIKASGVLDHNVFPPIFEGYLLQP